MEEPGQSVFFVTIRQAAGRGETATFEYADEWLGSDACFSIEPALRLTKGLFASPPGLTLFGSLGDSAPDTWGRRLMQRAERRNADRDGRRVRTLGELDYLLGVSDETRLGAMRFRRVGDDIFQAPDRGVPPIVELGRLRMESAFEHDDLERALRLG